MTDIERAIETLEYVREWLKDNRAHEDDNQAMTLAIEALREKQQREDAGAWLNGLCSRCNAPIPTDHKYDYLDVEDNNYCYNCGVRTKPQSGEGG